VTARALAAAALLDLERQMTMQEYAARNSRARSRYAGEFRRTFGVNLARPYWDNLFGFDVTAFDDGVIQSGERPTLDVVRERYGERAAQMVSELVGVA
jgi:hypothetical protein